MFDALIQQVAAWGDTLLGLSLKSEDIGFGHMAARAALMYVILIWVIRSAKKRFLGEATVFDVVLVIVLGSVAARALTGGAPYFPAALGMIVLVFMHWVFSYVARTSPWFSGLIKGHSTRLVINGRINQKALRDAHMSRDDLDEDLRQKGVADLAEVAEARLERNGKLSVIKSK